ncbi:MAG: trypsin-like serine protease [Polyangiaceae bacterium]|nr:trypsin-like serine protease [Polyangiaceae bacterium]
MDPTTGRVGEEMVYCPDFQQTIPQTTAAPEGAIGFINNGCTAALIDDYHIVTAAHCVRNADTGQWDFHATPYRFYPNFHPCRVNPPRYSIVRAVAGYIAEGNLPNANMVASDWAIARLGCSTAPGGQQWCPPVTGFPKVSFHGRLEPAPAVGQAVMRGGYDRDLTKLVPPLTPFHALCPPYTDEPNSCGVVPPSNCISTGLCPEQASGCNNFNNNWWWNHGFVDPSCAIVSVTNDYLGTSCSARGGSSGSPILMQHGSKWLLQGVVHGTAFMADNVACVPDVGANVTPGASLARFRDVPRFASNVAMARHQSGSNRTQVWATDSETGSVRTRSRTGTNLTDGWQNWDNFGGLTQADRIAASRLANNYPQVLVTTTGGGLFHRQVESTGSWSKFTAFGQPSGTTIRDVDAATDSAGNPCFFGVGNTGQVWRRKRTGSGAYDPWAAWQALITTPGTNTYTKVTSIRRHGDLVQMAFMRTTTGAVRWIQEPFPAASPSDFGAPASIVDLDAGWTNDNRVMVIALDAQGSLWIRVQLATTGAGWFDWISFNPPFGPKMFTPANQCNNNGLPGIASVTVSRWQENPISTVVPVIFVTDDRGNVYYSTYEQGPCTQAGCDCSEWFQPWKAFYHSKRWADY